MDEVDPELKRTFDKLGIPLEEQMALAGVAVDAVMDSVSVKTTFKEVLAEKGIVFCSISEALRDFSDGSFCYIPRGVRCPMELSTYFRINAAGTGQFERTLIVADEGAYVSYLEGCTAPRRDENQLHAAVVEIIVEKDAEVKYSTVQNWYPGDKQGRGGIYNFVTKRGICRENARLFVKDNPDIAAEIDKIIRDEAKQALAAGKGVGKEEAPTDEERANADVDEDPDLALLDEE